MGVRLYVSGWVVLGGTLVAAVVLAGAGTRALQLEAVHDRGATNAADVVTGVDHLNALEWRARYEQGASAEVRADIGRTRRNVETSFAALVRLNSSAASNLRSYHAYNRAIDAELGFLSMGNVAAAAEVDRRRVDPRATRLARAIAKQSRQMEGHARSVNKRSQQLLLGAVFAAALLVALLAWQFFLQQRGRRIDRELSKHLQMLGRQKDEFVATVSHELRTPLTSICGYVELLAGDPSLSQEQGAWVDVVGRNAKRLEALVSDLLFTAEVGAKKFVLNVDVIDLAAVVADAVEAAGPAAAQKGLELTTHGATPILLSGDAVRLAQVLDNLLSNAIKFTPPGGSVSVSRSLRGSTAVLKVTDTGTGIDVADQAKLFERFFRGEQAVKEAVPGSGLGLAISQTIVAAHAGTIGVSSAPGVGTTFTVELPAGSASRGARTSESLRPALSV